MSLLREAERCLANQKTYAHLNAFITTLERSTSWRGRLQHADARRESGRCYPMETLYIDLIAFLLNGGLTNIDVL